MKGLEGDEIEFLDYVSDKQEEIEKRRLEENESVLAELRVCYALALVDLSCCSYVQFNTILKRCYDS